MSLKTLRFIINHPLNRNKRLVALGRFFGWQIGSRLLPGAVCVPFVNETRLLVRRGMRGATGNVYCGLHEFEDMAFVLHFLRRTDVFMDIGANIGSYTVLASGAVGAKTISVEPVPATFTHLIDNLRINGIEGLVSPLNIGVGPTKGRLRFSADQGQKNHVIAKGEEATSTVEVAVDTVDELAAEAPPSLVKIDVEGFETQVVAGAGHTLTNPMLLGVIMELNGSGRRYGYDEDALHDRMKGYGFMPCRYQPLERAVLPLENRGTAGNTLYLRDLEVVRERLFTAPTYRVGKSRI